MKHILPIILKDCETSEYIYGDKSAFERKNFPPIESEVDYALDQKNELEWELDDLEKERASIEKYLKQVRK